MTAAPPTPPTAGGDPVSLIIQTRAGDGQNEAFGRWQARISAAVAASPGFLEQSVLPPTPPAQPDWVILQRFATQAAAIAWLNSAQRQQLLQDAEDLLVGGDDVHLVRDQARGVLPAPVSVVIATRIEPGQEAAYRLWEQRIAAAQAQAPGFQGYRFEPPIPGVQDDWLSILRFDSEQTLQRWMDSPERLALVNDLADTTAAFHTRVVHSGFDPWFALGAGAERMPATWKQNMVVLSLLYPIVFLFGAAIQTPLLTRLWHLPFWLALFIGNIASVVSLAWLVPRASRQLGWWLIPDVPRTLVQNIAGAALIVGFYLVCMLVFSRI